MVEASVPEEFLEIYSKNYYNGRLLSNATKIKLFQMQFNNIRNKCEVFVCFVNKNDGGVLKEAIYYVKKSKKKVVNIFTKYDKT